MTAMPDHSAIEASDPGIGQTVTLDLSAAVVAGLDQGVVVVVLRGRRTTEAAIPGPSTTVIATVLPSSIVIKAHRLIGLVMALILIQTGLGLAFLEASKFPRGLTAPLRRWGILPRHQSRMP